MPEANLAPEAARVALPCTLTQEGLGMLKMLTVSPGRTDVGCQVLNSRALG